MEEVKVPNETNHPLKIWSPFFLMVLVVFVLIGSVHLLALFDISSITYMLKELQLLIGHSKAEWMLILSVMILLIACVFILLKRIGVSRAVVKRFRLIFMLLTIPIFLLLLSILVKVLSGSEQILFLSVGVVLYLLIMGGIVFYFVFAEYIVFSILAWFVSSKEEREDKKI